MKDSLASVRRKARLIVEIRYEVVPEFIDYQGRIISQIHPAIRTDFPYWRTDFARVLFLDREDNPENEFVLSTKRTSVILEDPGSLQRFVDSASKYLTMGYQALKPSPTTISRLGVRFIEVLARDEDHEFERIRQLCAEKLHRIPEDAGLKYKDSMSLLVHEYGRFQVGPAKQDDTWVQGAFRNPGNAPAVGFAVDIDSYQTDLRVANSKDLVTAFRAVLDLTTAVEIMLAKHLGLL